MGFLTILFILYTGLMAVAKKIALSVMFQGLKIVG